MFVHECCVCVCVCVFVCVEWNAKCILAPSTYLIGPYKCRHLCYHIHELQKNLLTHDKLQEVVYTCVPNHHSL